MTEHSVVAAAVVAVTNHEGEFAPGRDSYWLVKLPPATREELVEKGPINPEHDGGGPHRPARASSNCLGGGHIMSFGEHSQVVADVGERRLGSPAMQPR
jgi:hypothetical protein